ncbi:MGAT4C [Symbiodinium sp. CCMP2592]|nr:MGAT4C [Symbiodinium sp. CCMP2592]
MLRLCHQNVPMTDADADACIEEVRLEHFHTWLEQAQIRPSEILHLKGFGGNVPSFFDKEAVTEASRSSLLVWDGDELKETSFTRLIPEYLKSGESRRVVAFRINDSIDSFKASWKEVAAAHPGRIAVVPVDLADLMSRLRRYEAAMKDIPPGRQKFVMLGRLAIEASGAKQVVALGGGSISQKEAELSCGEDTGECMTGSIHPEFKSVFHVVNSLSAGFSRPQNVLLSAFPMGPRFFFS